MIPLLFALACAPSPVEAETPVEVRTWLEGADANGATVVVQVESDVGLQVEPPVPHAQGLESRPVRAPRVEAVGERTVHTARYRLTGTEGSYEIAVAPVSWAAPDGSTGEAAAPALYVDLGVDPPRQGELADIVEPWPVPDIPWVPVAVVGLSAAGSLGGLLLLAWRWRRRPGDEPEPVPPDVAALVAWEDVRRDPTLDDMERAVAISRIFREYLEAVLGFAAESWTTRQILDHLGTLRYLPEGSVPRAMRLLRATDRVKYAEEPPGDDLFVELGEDLASFVAATRSAREGES